MESQRHSSALGLLLLLHVSDVIIQAQNSPPPPRWVNGILGGSALLPLDVTSEHILEIEWRFVSGVIIRLGQFKNRIFNEFNFSTRFHQRLQMYKETTLKVDGLEMRDTGTFDAHITFTTGYLVKQDFHLTVYEPVPTPQISLSPSISDRCNVTLRCLVPAHAAVNVTWIVRAAPAHLHQPSPDPSILQLVLTPSTEEKEYVCVASNPVDTKSISINTSSLCLNKGRSEFAVLCSVYVRHIIFSVFLVLEISAVILVNLL
ncbi:SLAM family member 6-like [Microcaecilia unicolor]|uniref:SLAM family member 6-like n=1 Tax=Microcaecilia unicolor TaxID=1415580 RepID=A0A6P7WNW4_9AMPH|nr:SLAM family member 6-like [Microcaecilia unicolor]